MTELTQSDLSSGERDIESWQTVSFLALYLIMAFVLMTGVTLAASDLVVRGPAFLIAHAIAAGVSYRVVVAPQIDANAVGSFDTQVEKLAASFGVLAVLKHVLLLVLGRASDALARADQVLVWIVDTTYLNTSLLPDVAALGIIALTIRAVEHARSGPGTV